MSLRLLVAHDIPKTISLRTIHVKSELKPYQAAFQLGYIVAMQKVLVFRFSHHAVCLHSGFYHVLWVRCQPTTDSCHSTGKLEQFVNCRKISGAFPIIVAIFLKKCEDSSHKIW